MLKHFFLFVFVLMLHSTFAAHQPKTVLRTASLFTNHMVLQRDMRAPVWGMAEAEARVFVEIAGKLKSTTADAKGRWLVRLPKLPAGGPYTLMVSSGKDTIRYHDVMIGDVWLASGQSNMAFTMSTATGAKEAIAGADFPQIRLFNVPFVTSPVPQDQTTKAAWKICSPKTVANFSAIAYYFARSIYQSKGVAIGVINSSVGGSAAEAWTSRNMLETLPEFKAKMAGLATDTLQWNKKVRQIQAYQQVERPAIIKGAQEGVKLGAHLPGYQDGRWLESDYPITMNKLGLRNYWGFVWFRKGFSLTAEEAAKRYSLKLPLSCNELILFVNGKKIDAGSLTQSPAGRFVIPGGALQSGKNVIALRLLTFYGVGQLGFEASDKPGLCSDDEKTLIPLAGSWKYSSTIEPRLLPDQAYFNEPTVLYNAMIAPLAGYGLKGIIWYQGETNASNPIAYRTLFPAMIKDWRKKWQQGNFPFLFVQLAGRQKEGEMDLKYALLREAQTYALRLPNTAMATAIDLGERFETHPGNKKDVGLRLALAALKVAYKDDIVYSGPTYRDMYITKGIVHLSFKNTGAGLWIKGAALEGFKIAGNDHRFYPASAVVAGNEVLVSSSLVAQPLAVRYCFESWSTGNLYNKEGIAAPQFRTDTWEVLTGPPSTQ